METMTPSTEPITDEQIGKVSEVLTAKLKKHRKQLPRNLSQHVLGAKNSTLWDELFTVFQKHVDAISNMIVRTVKVNRTQSPQEMLNATGRKQYANSDVVATIPRGEGEEKEVFFFKLDRYVSDDELEKEYELRGQKPADPYSLAKVNQDDPAFADTHPNGTHWKDESGNWNFSAFFRGSDERNVFVSRSSFEWDHYWWFAGVRK